MGDKKLKWSNTQINVDKIQIVHVNLPNRFSVIFFLVYIVRDHE